MNKKYILPIFLVVFIDMVGFGLILPLLPFYAQEYGATPFIIGMLIASYAAASIIGSPILGRLSDKYGRKKILILSILGTAIGFLLLAFADRFGSFLALLFFYPQFLNFFIIFILFISRILDGLTAGNITVSQAYISDITDEKSRAKSLGLIGAAFGFGFIIGPALGGFFSQWGV